MLGSLGQKTGASRNAQQHNCQFQKQNKTENTNKKRYIYIYVYFFGIGGRKEFVPF